METKKQVTKIIHANTDIAACIRIIDTNGVNLCKVHSIAIFNRITCQAVVMKQVDGEIFYETMFFPHARVEIMVDNN